MSQETKPPTKKTYSSSKRDNEVILKIANSFIKIGESYEVVPKKDVSAPDGMQQRGTTKFLHEGNKESRAVYFDESRRAYDTGFYRQSMCHSNMLNEDVAYIEQYIKYVKEPYEAAFKVNTDETNFEFWDSYRYEIKTNKSFKTSDPKDLFDLFHALTQARICEANEKDSILQKANYNIRNLEVEKSLEDERLEDKFDATNHFLTLLSTDKEKLYAILEWIQMSDVRNSEDKVIKSTFLRAFDNPNTGYDFARRFLEGLEMYGTDSGKKQMEYFIMCQKLILKNKIEKKQGTFYYDGMLLGNTVKEISLKALSNNEISDLIIKAFKSHIK